MGLFAALASSPAGPSQHANVPLVLAIVAAAGAFLLWPQKKKRKAAPKRKTAHKRPARKTAARKAARPPTLSSVYREVSRALNDDAKQKKGGQR
jgi:Flp pilus assembly protein TadB